MVSSGSLLTGAVDGLCMSQLSGLGKLLHHQPFSLSSTSSLLTSQRNSPRSSHLALVPAHHVNIAISWEETRERLCYHLLSFPSCPRHLFSLAHWVPKGWMVCFFFSLQIKNFTFSKVLILQKFYFDKSRRRIIVLVVNFACTANCNFWLNSIRDRKAQLLFIYFLTFWLPSPFSPPSSPASGNHQAVLCIWEFSFLFAFGLFLFFICHM